MRAVNLLPRDEQTVRLEGTRAPFLVAVGGIAAVTVAAGVVGFSASGAASADRAELAAVQAAIAKLPKAPEPAVSQGVLTQERTDRTIALSAALSSRIAFDRLLREVSLVLPDDAWLTGVKALAPDELEPPAGTPGATPSATVLQGVTIQGATYSHASVARVLSRLSIVPSLENVALTASALVAPVELGTAQAPGAQAPAQPKAKPKKKGRAVVTFTITASLRTGRSS